jgi:hypothetical protein
MQYTELHWAKTHCSPNPNNNPDQQRYFVKRITKSTVVYIHPCSL